MKPVISTTAAVASFAGNSILCRLALGGAAIDPASFSTIRFAAGAAMLLAVSGSVGGGAAAAGGSWTSAAVLFLYAIPFSFAYTKLTTGTGALILFGAVQLTMMAAAFASGERPRLLHWAGLTLALAGLVYLVLPGLTAPSPVGSVLMAVAGLFWGVYSLRGRGTANPLANTAGNFVRAVPMMVAVSLIGRAEVHVGVRGASIAAASGALTSGLGYVVWYSALRSLTATRAAAVQLVVPILAAAGGVVFMHEALSSRLILSAALVIGGIGMTLAPHN